MKCCKVSDFACGRALKGMLLVFSLVLLLPLFPYAFAEKHSPIVVPNPGTDLWRAVRHASEGSSQVKGVDTGVLVDDNGKSWLEFRVKKLVPYSAYLLGGVLSVFLLYFLIRGRIKIEGGPSGRVVQRTTRIQRWAHWFVAIVFVILMLTGLVMLYGRWVLIPLLGPDGFSGTAQVAKTLHDYVGVLFVVGVPLLFVVFIREALIKFKVDAMWIVKGGGYLGGSHPLSGKLNAGQKLWYWTAVLGGVVLCVTGLILDFPNFEQGREVMQTSHMVHTIAAVVVTAFFFVHIYLSTLGMEGVFRAMTTGNVDSNWAKQHHILWYEEIKDQAVPESEPSEAADIPATAKQPG